jgi:hypothetical protein
LPNYATNYVTILGTRAQIDALIDAAITPGTGGKAAHLDFEKILPCPPELRATVSPPKIVETAEQAQALNAQHAADNPQVGRTVTWALTTEEAELRAATYGMGVLGAPILTWYEWCIAHWGTKWGVVDASTFARAGSERLNLVFTTAWSTPRPIFAELERRYGVVVHARALIEGGYEDETYGDPEDYMDDIRTIEFH